MLWPVLGLLSCGGPEPAEHSATDSSESGADPSTAAATSSTSVETTTAVDGSTGNATTGDATTDDAADTELDTGGTQTGDSGAPGCPPRPPGEWADCADGDSCMSADSTCVSTGRDGEGSCIFTPPSATGCADACECPGPPRTGTAVVTCADLPDANREIDGVNDCYLSCDDGETCPEGQICFLDRFCVHTNTPPGPPVEPYQGCDPPLFPCPAGSMCLQDDADEPTVATCAQQDCIENTDCPAAADGTPICSNVDGIEGLECTLGCTDDDGCPAGASCFGQLCAFPIPQAGYQACVPVEQCHAFEDCHQVGGEPSYSVCAQTGCQDADDCPVANYGGDAPITCGDTGDGVMMCHLDCSLGQACPPGMSCAADVLCAFESLGEVCVGAILDPSFEAGTPSEAWVELSTNTATPVCDEPSCGGAGAFTGDLWVRFGGVVGVSETGSIAQDVIIPLGATQVVFQLWIFNATTSNPELDTLTVAVDGNSVFQVTAADAAAYASYTLASVDISAYANGMNHTIRIEGQTQGDEATNFFVDDVLLMCPSG